MKSKSVSEENRALGISWLLECNPMRFEGASGRRFRSAIIHWVTEVAWPSLNDSRKFGNSFSHVKASKAKPWTLRVNSEAYYSFMIASTNLMFESPSVAWHSYMPFCKNLHAASLRAPNAGCEKEMFKSLFHYRE